MPSSGCHRQLHEIEFQEVQEFHVTPDDGIVYRKMYIESVSCAFVILNLMNPDLIIIMYHLELTPNYYEMSFCTGPLSA
jgi:hypothetical protein